VRRSPPLRPLVSGVAAICAAALLAGCGGSPPPVAAVPGASAQQVAPVTRAPSRARQLPDLARGLVPPAARASVTRKDLAVKECGISPTYPCISTFFTLGNHASERERMTLLRGQARRNGWRFVRSRPFGTGVSLELTRGAFHARYAMARGLAPGSGIIGLDLYGPANTLTRPSGAEKAQWSHEKRRYIDRANTICASTLGRMRKAADVAPAVSRASRALHALRPPSGDTEHVESFLRPLQSLARAMRALSVAKGEDALGAVIALGSYTKRFDRAAARYGLTRCTIH
jgi:hypothetical protein